MKRELSLSAALYVTIILWSWRTQFFPYMEGYVGMWPACGFDLDKVTMN